MVIFFSNSQGSRPRITKLPAYAQGPESADGPSQSLNELRLTPVKIPETDYDRGTQFPCPPDRVNKSLVKRAWFFEKHVEGDHFRPGLGEFFDEQPVLSPPAFIKRFPQESLSLVIDDHQKDLVAEGFLCK